jgi:hypothetical protein
MPLVEPESYFHRLILYCCAIVTGWAKSTLTLQRRERAGNCFPTRCPMAADKLRFALINVDGDRCCTRGRADLGRAAS